MKILICGAGPLGSILGHLFVQAGIDVTLLARGTRFSEVQNNGLQIQPFEKTEVEKSRIPVIEKLPSEVVYDFDFVIMRKNQAVPFVKTIANSLPCKKLLILGNNPLGFDTYANILRPETYTIGFVLMAGHTEEGITRAIFDKKSSIIIGPNPSDPHSLNDLIKLQCYLQEKGFGVEISPNIDSWLKYHAALIVPLAALLYQTNCDTQKIVDSPTMVLDTFRAIRETLNGLRFLKYPVLPKYFHIFRLMPLKFLAKKFAPKLNTPQGQLALVAHAKAAWDEMAPLSKEFMSIIRENGRKTPYLDKMMMIFNKE